MGTNGLSPEVAKRLAHRAFYTYDGSWRCAEPSWRVLLHERENLRGCSSADTTLNDPTLLNSLTRGRRGMAPSAPMIPEYGRPEAAHAAAQAYLALNFKDQKLSGFANETLCHTGPVEANDPERWGRLGIMTRERLTVSDRFGDIEIAGTRPVTAPEGLWPTTFPKQGAFPREDAEMRPANAETSGFTRGELHHKPGALTGGFVYKPPPAAANPPPTAVKVVGNKLPTGFQINNADVAAEDALERLTQSEVGAKYLRTSIGSKGTGSNWYDGVSSRVTKFGDLRPRKLAPHEREGPVNTLRVETSGYSRTQLHERDHVRQVYLRPGVEEPKVERKLQASQLALRMMADPIEYTDPHAHKLHAPR